MPTRPCLTPTPPLTLPTYNAGMLYRFGLFYPSACLPSCDVLCVPTRTLPCRVGTSVAYAAHTDFGRVCLRPCLTASTFYRCAAVTFSVAPFIPFGTTAFTACLPFQFLDSVLVPCPALTNYTVQFYMVLPPTVVPTGRLLPTKAPMTANHLTFSERVLHFNPVCGLGCPIGTTIPVHTIFCFSSFRLLDLLRTAEGFAAQHHPSATILPHTNQVVTYCHILFVCDERCLVLRRDCHVTVVLRVVATLPACCVPDRPFLQPVLLLVPCCTYVHQLPPAVPVDNCARLCNPTTTTIHPG